MAANEKPQTATDAYYRQLCEHLGVAVIATDRDLDIRAWNASAARMFGAAADRMIGTPIVSMFPQERREEARRMFTGVIASGETFDFEFQSHDKQGKGQNLIGTIAPVVSASGARTGASVAIRDITRWIALKDELSETRKLASLGELAGAIAHHFNNILGGVMTSVDYANATGDPIILRRVTQQIGGALQRAANLIGGLLAFAEGDQRAEDLADFTEVINDVTHDIEGMIEGGSIELVVNLPEMPVLPTARAQVTTALHNIAQNAVEAMPDGGTLTVDVSLADEAIVTRVCDSGCGLDEHARLRVFEPFWSTKGELSSESGEGTGLGLAIAHGLVQMIGGAITVTSELGKGSCFTVTLPRPQN
ncbi:MAG: PAS domain S-box protein [Phycisphaerales bacterium]|nr:MAG: PAS domain S-box protein [Phycisphaerales bacterium]